MSDTGTSMSDDTNCTESIMYDEHIEDSSNMEGRNLQAPSIAASNGLPSELKIPSGASKSPSEDQERHKQSRFSMAKLSKLTSNISSNITSNIPLYSGSIRRTVEITDDQHSISVMTASSHVDFAIPPDVPYRSSDVSHARSQGKKPKMAKEASEFKRFMAHAAAYISTHRKIILLPTLLLGALTFVTLFATHQMRAEKFVFTQFPSTSPSISTIPSISPSSSPTDTPSSQPTGSPSGLPTSFPTSTPSMNPTGTPTAHPSSSPTAHPTSSPSAHPTSSPTASPTSNPSSSPTSSPTISSAPTRAPSHTPTLSHSPTASPSSSPTNNFLIFYVMGDVPYNEKEEEELKDQLDEIPNDASFIFHVGDVQRAKDTNCTWSTFRNVRNILKRSPIPVFVTPGDNDYNDCPDPPAALSRHRNQLGKLNQNWKHDLNVKYQQNRIENVAFLHEFVLFISVNMVGKPVHDKEEWEDRISDNYEWTMAQLKNYKNQYSAVVIFGHAGIGGMRDDDYFEPLVEYGEKKEIPMVYFHGDGHDFDVDTNIHGSDYFWEVQVDNGGSARPLKVVITEGVNQPFKLIRRWK